MINIEKTKIWKTGNSHVITIPRIYIAKGILTPGVCYEISIKADEKLEKDK